MMPEFYKISFDAEELEALREACSSRSRREDRRLDEAAAGSLEGAVMQEEAADEMFLIKSTVAIFKPGQAILITGDDLRPMRQSLEAFKNEAPAGLVRPAERAIEKIDAALRHPT